MIVSGVLPLPRNPAGKLDEGMQQTSNATRWHFGIKAPDGVSARSG